MQYNAAMSSRTNGDVASASPGVGAGGAGAHANITFDPYSKCIRFPTPSQNSTPPPTLKGVIVDMSPGAEAFFAKMASNHLDSSERIIYTGEIIDILDHNDASAAADEAKNKLSQHQTIRHLQSKHAYQTQQLLHQHSTTRHDYENTAAVERKHYLEIMRLMRLQQEDLAAEFRKVINTATYNNNQEQQSVQQEKEEPADDAVVMADVGSVSEPEEALPEGVDVEMNEENELAAEETHEEEAPPRIHDLSATTDDDAKAVDDVENQDDSNMNEYGATDPTPQKSNTMTSKYNEEQSNIVQDDDERGESDGSSSDASANAKIDGDNVNNDDDLDQKMITMMNQAKEEEEEEEGIDNSYRSNDISIKSVHFEMDKEMDEQGTFDGSLRSARSNRSLRSGGGGSSIGGKRPSIIRTNSNRSASSIKSERSGTDEGTFDGSMKSNRSGRSGQRSARSGQSQGSNRSGRSMKSDHSDADEGTQEDSLGSARSGRSGRSDRSSRLDSSNRSARSMKSDHSGTRDGSLRSARSGKSMRSNTSNRSGRRDDNSENEEGTRDGSMRSNRSDRSRKSVQSGKEDTRDASLKSARSDGSSRSRSSSSSRSSRSGRSQRSSNSDNSNHSGRSVKSDRSESVGSRNSSVASARSSKSGRSSRSRSSDRSESDRRGSREGWLESDRSNRSEVSGRSRSPSIHDDQDESSRGGRSASDRSSVASERDGKDEEEKEEAPPQSAVIEEPVQKEVPQRPRAPPSRAADTNSRQRRKASKEEMAEIKEVMKDRSLDRTERLEKVQQIKARYAALEKGSDNVDEEEQQDVMVSEAIEMPQAEADNEEQGSDEENEREQSKEEKAEIKKVKKDKSLSKKDKKKMIKKITAKYDKLEKERKAAENVVVPIEGEQGEAIGDDPEQSGHGEEIKRETSKEEKAEMKKVMKDDSLSKKEKKKKIKKIKAKYDEIEKERKAVENANAPIEGHQGGAIGDEGQEDQANNDEEIKRETSKEEKAEIKKVMKDKSLSKKDKKKMIKKIKAKYDKEMATATQDNVNAETNVEAEAINNNVNYQYAPKSTKVQERSVSPVPVEPSARSISPLPLHSNNTSSSSIPKDLMAPLEDEGLQTDRTPMKKLVKMMESNDPLLDVLKLDGRKKVKPEDWEAFFQSLESNNSLTHLSISRCDLSDEIAVNLVLALVDNETLVALKLSSNKGLTDETGKGFIKVLTQSNKTLKKLDLSKTRISKRAHEKINGIMEKRDNQKKLTMMQEMRQNKIKELLSFSAGDNVAAKRLSEATADSDDEGNDGSVYSGRSGKSGRRQSVRTGAAGRGMNRTASGRQLAASMRASKRSLNASGQSLNLSGHGLNASRGAGMRSSMTARTMAQLGGDSLGADTKKIREQRKLKGECEDCGQRCFQKTMFKSTPLTIPNVVYEGRCLKCNPM